MVNIGLITSRLTEIRTSAQRLKRFTNLSSEEFASDPDNFAIGEHHLRRALEALLDIGRHIVAKQAMGQPKNYSEILALLGHNGVLSNDFAKQIAGMAGYRNRLVHAYAEVGPEELHTIIVDNLGDFATFEKQIVTYLKRENLL